MPGDPYFRDRDADADATVTLTRAALNDMLEGKVQARDSLSKGTVQVGGRAEAVTELLSLLDTFDLWFNMVEP